MASKVKNAKQLQQNEEEQWPDLPQQLVNLMGWKPDHHLIQKLSGHGVTKSWRSAASRKCSSNGKSPCLEVCHVSGDGASYRHRLSITFRQGFYWFNGLRPREDPWQYILGCSHGLLVVGGNVPCTLYDPTSHYYHGRWKLPKWNTEIPFQCVTLASSPYDTNGCCVMALTGSSTPAFVISCIRYTQTDYWTTQEYPNWIKQDCILVDPNGSNGELMKFTNAVGFKRKFYALSLQGTLAVIEEVNSQFKITRLIKNRAIPSVHSKHFIEYLLESNGEILLVFLISKKSVRIIDHVEVFKLHLRELSWMKVETLGDRTLFMGTNCCMSVTSSQVGCRSNSVYFTHEAIKGWQLFDMTNSSIFPCYEIESQTKSPIWGQPTADA